MYRCHEIKDLKSFQYCAMQAIYYDKNLIRMLQRTLEEHEDVEAGEVAVEAVPVLREQKQPFRKVADLIVLS